jgi:hypothetical protein
MAAHTQDRVSVVFLLLCVFRGNTQIYLWNTLDAVKVESYDCVRVHLSSLDYCRRPQEPIHLSRDNDTTECERNRGKTTSFQ